MILKLIPITQNQKFYILLLYFHRLLHLFFISILLLNPPIYSQEIRFEQLLIEQGLSHRSVNCILQDKQGFMWFGTDDGLNRFDGYEFKVYTNTNGDLSSLSDNYIITLYEDSGGNIWVGTLMV